MLKNLRRPLFVLGVFLAAGRAAAQVPAGGEFLVNTYTTGQQSTLLVGQTVAAARDGRFAVAWWGDQQVGGQGTFVQLFDPSGARIGAEQEITSATGPGPDPAVAFDRSGRFAVGYTSGSSLSADIDLRRFDRDGRPLGASFMVNTWTPGFQYGPSIAFSGSGEFVVSWTSENQDGDYRGVFARLFDRAGDPRGPEFQVNTYTAAAQASARTAISGPSGNFVVVWRSEEQDGSENGVYGQRYDREGTRIGGEFRVNTYTTGHQYGPRIAADREGRLVVAWTSLGQDNGFDGIYAQRYDAGGAPIGGEFKVSTYTTSAKALGAVAADEAGNFVVTWSSDPQDGDRDAVVARRFDSSGSPRGGEFLVNTTASHMQVNSSVATDAAGNFVADWSHWELPSQDIDVRAQRYGGLVPAALVVDAAASATSDGNGVLEAGEAVAVAPAWRNVNGTTQTFLGAAASFVGPGLPGNPVYAVSDPTATYGTVASGATVSCTLAGDCLAVSVSQPTARPAPHWDATLREDILPVVQGQSKLWSLHVGDTFTDVLRASLFYRFIETLVHEGVTAGCGSSSYCPLSSTTREQMAVFVLVAREGAGYLPAACGAAPAFADVPVTSPFCRWIEELARRGVVAGCGGGNYCPAGNVTREQMAVFVLRALDPTLNPPACGTPVFADVPAASPFCRWIEELARRGVAAGCGGGNYCPLGDVTREQMAVFLGATFGLALYGP